MRDLKFAQCQGWGFTSSKLIHWVAQFLNPNILKEYTAFMFIWFLEPWRWRQYVPSKCQESEILLLSVTTHKTWILRLKCYTHTYTQKRMHACTYVCVHACVCVCVYVYVCVCTHYVCMYVCMYVHSASYRKKVEGRTHETKQMTKAILAYFIKVLKQIVQVLHHHKRRTAVSLLRFW